LKTWRKNTGKRKNQLDQPDEFISLTQRVLDYARENTSKVYTALGVAGVAIVLTILVSMLMHNREKHLVVRQSEALQYYDVNTPAPGGKTMTPQERYKKASALFGGIIKDAGGSPAAEVARYYKANADLELGDTAAAIEGYKTIVEGSGKDAVMMSLAAERLASAYIAKGETDKAISVYLGVIKLDNSYLKDEARFHLARIYENIGKKDEAVKEYEAIKKESPNSPWANESEMKVAELTGKPMPIPQGMGMPGGQQMQVIPIKGKPAGQAAGAPAQSQTVNVVPVGQPAQAPAAKK